jgi:hypothetical protein
MQHLLGKPTITEITVAKYREPAFGRLLSGIHGGGYTPPGGKAEGLGSIRCARVANQNGRPKPNDRGPQWRSQRSP